MYLIIKLNILLDKFKLALIDCIIQYYGGKYPSFVYIIRFFYNIKYNIPLNYLCTILISDGLKTGYLQIKVKIL